MKKILCYLLLLMPTLASAQSGPEAFAYVTALQPPVWIFHKGERMALGASSPVLMDDALLTGPGGRAHLALADGSLLKLAENTSLGIPYLQLRRNGNKDVLTATLKLVHGTLRYTAQKESSSLSHDLDFEIGNAISAHVPNADLWGRVGTSEDRLVLLDGKMTADSPKQPTVKLTQAGQAYVVPRNKPPRPVSLLSAQETQTLMPSTELDSSYPALQSNGPYRLVLAIYNDEAKAIERVKRYVQLGYPVELHSSVKSANPRAYRLTLEGLVSAADASAYARVLVEKLNLVNPRVEAPAP